MKKLASTLLTITLISSLVFSLYSCEKQEQVFYGEVMYVKDTEFARESEDLHSYYLYVKPYGEESSEIWWLFKVDKKSQTESIYSTNREKMSELSVGNIVEIVFNINPKEDENLVTCYYAKSIKTTKENVSNNNDIDIAINDKYNQNVQTNVFNYCGTVIHVARIDAPVSGYLIYCESEDYTQFVLECYWIEDGNTVISPLVRDKLKSGENGWRTHVKVFTNGKPLQNINAMKAMSIDFCTDHFSN